MASIPILQISLGHLKLATAATSYVFYCNKKKTKCMRLHLAYIMLENFYINTTTSITVEPISALLIFFLNQ